MSLLWFDGADHYDATGDFADEYLLLGASLSTGTKQTGRRASFHAYGDSNDNLGRYLGAEYGEVIVGMMIRNVFASIKAGGFIGYWLGGLGTVQVSVGVSTDGRLRAWRGPYDTGVLLCESDPGVFKSQEWQYIEARVKFDDSVGEVEIRRNGVSIVTVTGVDTQASSSGTCDIAGAGTKGSADVNYDDLYIGDTSGGFTFLGPVQARWLKPNGAGNSSDFTPVGDTNNWECVDEADPDDDTTYVSSGTSTNEDTYALENLPAAATTVHGVMNWVRARDDSSGTQINQITELSATQSLSAARTLGGGYEVYAHLLTAKPGGGNWTVADVNNALAGFVVV